jgi:UDP-galactopyranose mutase
MDYSGQIDEFFAYLHGELPYRSLRFAHFHDPREQVQPVGTVNFPNEYDYTRTTEFKHLTGQRCAGSSWIEEYPQAFRQGENDPYYPVPKDEYRALYRRYEAEAEKLGGRVIFAGRLGDYQYYNMDQAVARALSIFDKQIAV